MEDVSPKFHCLVSFCCSFEGELLLSSLSEENPNELKSYLKELNHIIIAVTSWPHYHVYGFWYIPTSLTLIIYKPRIIFIFMANKRIESSFPVFYHTIHIRIALHANYKQGVMHKPFIYYAYAEVNTNTISSQTQFSSVAKNRFFLFSCHEHI